MRLIVNVDELLDGYLRVLLRGRQAHVPEHFLDGAQVCALGQEVGGKGVPQRMRARLKVGAEPPDVLFHQAVDRPGGEPASTGVQEQRRAAGLRLPQDFFADGKVSSDGFFGFRTEGDDPSLRPLPRTSTMPSPKLTLRRSRPTSSLTRSPEA